MKAPPLVFLLIEWTVTLAMIAVSIAVVTLGYDGVLSYVLYVATALLLAYGVFAAVKCVPKLKECCQCAVKKFHFTDRLLGDYGYRTVTVLVCSLTINIGFAVFNSVLGIISYSVWYGALAGYYLLLSAIRCGVLIGWQRAKKQTNGNETDLAVKKLHVFRNCGIALLVLEIALTVAVTQMVLAQKPMKNSQIVAIGFAAYTFYKVVMAIVNLRKARKLHDPIVQAIRNIGLTDAAVSLLSLQTTLIAVFSEVSAAGDMMSLNAVTGFTVCALTIILGVLMIINANVRLKKLREGECKHAKQRESK